jgi:aldehyde:ferredoxin oxidoreductase
MLQRLAVTQFQELYKANYGISLDSKEAEKMANRTFNLLKLITKESNGLRKGELKKSPKFKNQTVC